MGHVAVGGTLHSEALPMAHSGEHYCPPCCELVERGATSFALGMPRKPKSMRDRRETARVINEGERELRQRRRGWDEAARLRHH